MGQARKRGLLYSDSANIAGLTAAGILRHLCFSVCPVRCRSATTTSGHPGGGYPISKDNRHRGRSVPRTNFKIGFEKTLFS